MKFRVLKVSFLFDRLYEIGEEVDLDIDRLAKNPDGTVNMKKHTSLEPLEPLPEPTVKVPPAPLTPASPAGPSGDERERLIVGTVNGLDHENDDHWTEGGKPSLKALELTLGFKVSRDEVEKLAPNARREKPAA